MKRLLNKGESKRLKKTVVQEDVAKFNESVVHPVCSTFALARDIEWATRQYVLEVIDDDEEGIGTHLSIDHKSPALLGEELDIYSNVESFDGSTLICSYQVTVGERTIAIGETGQKILKKDKIKGILSSLAGDGKGK